MHAFIHRRFVVAACLLSLAVSGCKPKEKPAAAPAPVPVVAAEVVVRQATNFYEVIGETRGSQDVEIRARVPGVLESIHFKEGSTVKSNDLLYSIDPAPLEASLRQATGSFEQAQASWEKARRDTNRFGPLLERRAISRQQYDDAVASERMAAGILEGSRAAVESARIQLGYTRIYAPVAGIVGKTEVNVGNLVGQGSPTLLTTISALDPIHVRFSVSEQDYIRWRHHSAGKAPAPGIFEMVLSDGSTHPFRGDLAFGDREIDPRTGTFLIQVSFPNPGSVLRPGQFARVRFPEQVITNAVLVPQRAIQELQGTYAAFVVGGGNQAEFRPLKLGGRRGTLYIVREGLKTGDTIVIDGIQKLRQGVPLSVTMTNYTEELDRI